MALKPPALWIELRGRQHRVYWRNAPGLGLPARSYQPGLYSKADAQKFVEIATHLGLDTARQAMAANDEATRRALLAAAVAERGLVPAPAAAPAPITPPLAAAPMSPAFVAPAGGSGTRTVGVTFDELWARFLTKIRHVDEGTFARPHDDHRHRGPTRKGGATVALCPARAHPRVPPDEVRPPAAPGLARRGAVRHRCSQNAAPDPQPQPTPREGRRLERR
ncbi:MAG: hypothetical protein JWO98_513 [Frankiales bacterium]|nr:hypothetical protein [Frankiales bacterium]